MEEETAPAAEPETATVAEDETPADVAMEVGDRVFSRVSPYIYGLTVVFTLLFIFFPAHSSVFLIAGWTTLFLGVCLIQVWAMLYDAVAKLIIAAICGLHALTMFLVFPYLLSGRYIVGILGAAVEFGLVIVLSTWLAMRFNRWKRA